MTSDGHVDHSQDSDHAAAKYIGMGALIYTAVYYGSFFGGMITIWQFGFPSKIISSLLCIFIMALIVLMNLVPSVYYAITSIVDAVYKVSDKRFLSPSLSLCSLSLCPLSLCSLFFCCVFFCSLSLCSLSLLITARRSPLLHTPFPTALHDHHYSGTLVLQLLLLTRPLLRQQGRRRIHGPPRSALCCKLQVFRGDGCALKDAKPLSDEGDV